MMQSLRLTFVTFVHSSFHPLLHTSMVSPILFVPWIKFELESHLFGSLLRHCHLIKWC